MNELQDYFFGEMNAEERSAMEQRLAGSAELRAELRRLEMTSTALRMLPDEEPPQRIAFVSDKVFEPSWRGYLARWVSGAGPVLASALLSGMVVFAVTQRQPRQPVEKRVEVVKSVPQDPAQVQQMIHAAVAEAEARSMQNTRALLAEADRKHDLERKQTLLDVQDTIAYMQKKMNVLQVASADFGGPR